MAVNSILNQDFENIKIFISDDASTDNTSDILRDMKLAHPDKIELFIQPENLGITKNCNFLINICNTEYMCIIGGDDVLEPNCISRSIELALQNNVSIVFHLHKIINSDDNLVGNAKPYFANHVGIIDNFIKKGIYVYSNAMLVRTADIPQSGFDTKLPYAADFDFILQVLRNDNKFFAATEYLSSYRKHDQSITATKQYQCNLDTISTYEKLLKNRPNDKKSIMSIISNLQRAIRKFDTPDRYYFWLSNSIKSNPLNFKSAAALIVYISTFKSIRL